MKRLISTLFALLLVGTMCTGALAAGSAELVRAFVYDGTLYTYIAMEGMEKPVTGAEARLSGQTFAATDRLETVRQAGAPVTWLLLVDNSNSMPAFRRETEDFSQSLAQSGGENTRFILATFGDTFHIRAEDISPEELPGELEQIPFDELVTRLHTAISQALDYLEELPRERNELRCMVILSDGVQYDPAGGVPYEELLERVSRSDVMLHSAGLGGDQEALDRMGRLAEASGGTHRAIGEATAAEAGTALAEESGGLFVTGFDLSGLTAQGGTEEISVTLSSGGELICRAQAQVELPELTGEGGTGPDVPPPTQLPEPPAQASGETGGGAASPVNSPSSSQGISPAYIVGITAAMALVIVAAAGALIGKKRKRPVSPATGPAPQKNQGGIYMRLEVVQGELASGQDQQELEMHSELMIGADPACDVAVRSEDAALRHARLFLMEGAVYVEDLSPSGGARVNGVEFRGAQRLRSGDEITTGGVTLRLKF